MMILIFNLFECLMFVEAGRLVCSVRADINFKI